MLAGRRARAPRSWIDCQSRAQLSLTTVSSRREHVESRRVALRADTLMESPRRSTPPRSRPGTTVLGLDSTPLVLLREAEDELGDAKKAANR